MKWMVFYVATLLVVGTRENCFGTRASICFRDSLPSHCSNSVSASKESFFIDIATIGESLQELYIAESIQNGLCKILSNH